jgi:hypothetical protein
MNQKVRSQKLRRKEMKGLARSNRRTRRKGHNPELYCTRVVLGTQDHISVRPGPRFSLHHTYSEHVNSFHGAVLLLYRAIFRKELSVTSYCQGLVLPAR